MNASRDAAVSPGLIEALAAQVDASEKARRLADPSVTALRQAGLLRAMVPRRAGGVELDSGSGLALVKACARADSAAAWVLMVSSAHDWIIGSFPEQAQDEVWSDPDRVTPGSLAPSGSLEPVDGGFRVSGRWPFASGAYHGSWFLLGTVDQSAERPRLYHVVIPRHDLTLKDDWYTLGLRGTGSVDLLVEGAFVPEHRILDSGILFGARSEWAARHSTPVYKVPAVPGLTAWAASAVVGIAGGAFDAAVALMLEQKDRYTGKPKVDRPGLHLRLAEARHEIRCAELLLDDAVALLEQAAAGNDSLPLRARAKSEAAYAAELCRRAVDRLMATTGARSAFDQSPVQRAFRDVTMGSKHQMLNLDDALLVYGRTLVDLETGGFVL